MPGGAGGRKKPFSGKQKRLQLQTKRDRQHSKERGDTGAAGSFSRNFHSTNRTVEGERTGRGNREQLKNEFAANSDEVAGFGEKFFEVKEPTTRANSGRYALIFRKETIEEINKQKKLARKAIHPVLEEYLECTVEDFFTPELDFPIRPPWNYEISRDELERTEHKYFHDYLRGIDAKFNRNDLSYFELNLETWRQLWRVLEMSDIILVVVDARFPALLFPPKLYTYVCEQLQKQLIVVLNKVDLCPAPLVLAWKEYFKVQYPGIQILCFTSYPSYNLHGNQDSLQGKRRRGKMRMAAEGALELYKVCSELVKGEVDLASWKSKISEEMNTTVTVENEDESEIEIGNVVTEKADTGFVEFKKYNGGILTIGCLGQPNVGKSSLINALMGKKVVSVSRTPGHTKHFQTIFLTPNVRLCDCPGLIFPSKIPKPLQVLSGSYPIAQLREPYSTVKYLGERLDLPRILRISHPDKESVWSACDIADGWAVKRGYYTAKAARLDTYRAANQILRMALEGRICLCLEPPGYSSQKDVWGNDARVTDILNIQAKSQTTLNDQDFMTDSDEEEQPEPTNEEGEDDNSNSEESNKAKEGETAKPKSSTSTSQHSTKSKPSVIRVTNKFEALLTLDDEDGDDEEDEDDDKDNKV